MISKIFSTLTFLLGLATLQAHELRVLTGQTKTDSNQTFFKHLKVEDYGKATFSRILDCNNIYWYQEPAKYDNSSHEDPDISKAALYLNDDFQKGWTMRSGIEFEHTRTGFTYKKDHEEWEQEVKKNKDEEVDLEQIWLEKSFSPALNLLVGQLVVPFGLTNAQHEPLNFFTVYKSEGDCQLFPCTWHQIGLSLCGRYRNWGYEVQILTGLDEIEPTHDEWLDEGVNTPDQFSVANQYGIALKLDNYSLRGLRIGFSGYYGHAIDNADENSTEGTLRKKGEFLLGALDFTYNSHNWMVRGNANYGHLGDTGFIDHLAERQTKTGLFSTTPVSPTIIGGGIEGGWNLFSQFQKLRDEQQFYLFGRYDYYNSSIPQNRSTYYDYDAKNLIALGFNYFPIPQIVIKAIYSHRILKQTDSNKPSVSLGIAYQGVFH